jgi:hypothetical protein
VTDEAVVAAAGKIKCRKVHGWHGLKHPLFGYFYWFSEGCDGSYRRVTGSVRVAGISRPGARPLVTRRTGPC